MEVPLSLAKKAFDFLFSLVISRSVIGTLFPLLLYLRQILVSIKIVKVTVYF